MDAQLLKDYSRKLGISSSDAIKKAVELMRLAEVKCGSIYTGGNVSCQIVICLELAAVYYDIPVDRNQAVKLSGLTKKAYTSAFKAVEQQLDQKKSYSVRDLAIQFGCSEITSLASDVLQRYIARNQCEEDDENFNQVLFPAAALCATSKFKKVKIDKTKLQSLAGVKKSMYEELVGQMEGILREINLSKDDSRSKHSRGFSELLNEAVEDNLVKTKQKRSESSSKEAVDVDYEEWKRKILENARKYKKEQERKM